MRARSDDHAADERAPSDAVFVAMRLLIAGLVGIHMVACVSTAPTPSAQIRVSGVLLVPAEPALRASCVRAAAVGGFAVPCPRLVIEHRAAVGEGCPSQDPNPYAGGKDCLEDSAAGNPNLPSRRDAFTYIENDIAIPDALHLFVVGVKEDSRLAPFRTGCIGRESTEPGPDLDGIPTMWVECPDGSAMNSGHVLLRWRRNGILYAVSLHYQTVRNREIELAIARNIEYVGP